MSANFEELNSKVKESGKKKESVAVAEYAPILEAEEEARKAEEAAAAAPAEEAPAAESAE